MEDINYDRFMNLNFERFKALARDDSLTCYEKVGFPNSYREGKEEIIFADIVRKLSNLGKTNQLVMDIGPGCSGPAFLLIETCRKQGHTLLLVDSQEMLDKLPEEKFIVKVPAYYPRDCMWLFEKYAGKLNVILTYSVLHYVFLEGNPYEFVDLSLGLLKDGGEMLIGDIPNISKRKRFFASPNGIAFHQQFTKSEEVPSIKFNTLEPGQIDDAFLISILLRCRQAGFDAYWLSQPDNLPMANRREDILIRRP